jgi:Family of unknown function (DUF5999)
MCHHRPHCPEAWDRACFAARSVAAHPDQGWSLLCNGVIAFDDGGGLLPDGRIIGAASAATHHIPIPVAA